MEEQGRKLLFDCVAFDWDDGNTVKNWQKHQVTPAECEQIFFNHPLVVQNDIQHSKNEKRYFSLGQTDLGRHLFVAFTIRKKLIRVISARDMSRNERKVYSS